VFLAHLIEHLPVDAAFELLEQAARIVAPGGVLIVVTPNPACLAVLTNDFWSDPTHVRLYTLELLSFLLDQAGFDVVEAAGNPRDVPGAPPTLAAPPALVPWGDERVEIDPPPAFDYDQDLRLEGVLDELSRLRRALEGLVHLQRLHDDRLLALRHFATTAAERHDATLAHLWGPNEIYVVGERRS
jgi:SAM-dependent methyltransferase